MRKNTDTAWEKWGASDPYFAVLTRDKFHKDHINESRDEFFASGDAEVARILSRLERFSGYKPSGKALDFGCGVGRLTFALSRHFDTVHGFDVSPSMLSEANKNVASRAHSITEFRPSDDALSNADDEYDFVMSFIALQHIPVPRGMQFIGIMLDKLRLGGAFMFHISVRNWGSFKTAAYEMKSRLPFGQMLADLVAGRQLGTPGMEMNDYPVGRVLQMLSDRGIRMTVGETEMHTDALTFSITGQKPGAEARPLGPS